MKINSNITAYITNNSYLQNEKRLANSTAKLSSGYKLNKAGDDPANFAIANRMRMQLQGLDKVKTNAVTGSSVVETAESAITEIQDMIQRMNELAIKSANGTMSESDRSMIQMEVDKLKEEITRISETTEFNDMPLLDGTFEDRGFCQNRTDVKIKGYSQETQAGVYKLQLDYTEVPDMERYSVVDDTEALFGAIQPDMTGLEVITDDLGNPVSDPPTYRITLNSTREDGVEVRWESTTEFTANDVKDQLANPKKDYPMDPAGADDPAEKGYLTLKGMTNIVEGYQTDGSGNKILDADGNPIPIFKETTLKIEFDVAYQYTVSLGGYGTADEDKGIKNANDLLGSLSDPQDYHTSTYTVKDPENPDDLTKSTDYVTVTAKNGTELTLEIRDREQLKADGGELQFELTGLGSMRLQVGTEEGQTIQMSIPEMSLARMHIEDLDMTTQKDARQSIDKLSYALEYVNSARSRLGAYQNRLENTISYVDATNESLTSSYSRIRDTDMAEEMTEYTSLQVLTQAGMSMLAQANEFPQQALQLLQ